MNIIMDIIAEKRKLKLMPARIRVVVCIRLPTRERVMIRNTVANAKAKETKGTPMTKTSSPSIMATEAPREAPELTPRIYGSDKGFLKTA